MGKIVVMEVKPASNESVKLTLEVPDDFSVQRLQGNLSNGIYHMPPESSLRSLRLGGGDPINHHFSEGFDDVRSISPNNIGKSRVIHPGVRLDNDPHGPVAAARRMMLQLGIVVDIEQSGMGTSRVISPGVHVDTDPHGPVVVAERMMLQDLGNSAFNHDELVMLLIHATCLESGFIAVDSVSGSPFDRFKLVECQNPVTFMTSFRYTLPDDDVKESVMLEFETAEDYISVAGFLAESKVRLLELQIDKKKYFPKSTAAFSEKAENEISTAIKNGFVMPLMMGFCERVEAEFKSNFNHLLPDDLKLLVVNLLDGQDIARLACVSKDMRDLCSNNELWKNKFMSTFKKDVEDVTDWKAEFASSWLAARRKKTPFPPDVYLPRWAREEEFDLLHWW